jgi:hypothetical protein
MSRFTAGIVGIVLGATLLVIFIVWGGPSQDDPYRTGQFAGLAFGMLFLVAGGFYIVRGLQDLRQPPEQGQPPNQPRKKKRKRR